MPEGGLSAETGACSGYPQKRAGTAVAQQRRMRSISRRIVSGCQVLITALACAVVLFTAGCGDECQAGQTRCAGDTLQVCTDQSDLPFGTEHWVNNPCFSGVCRVIDGKAQCVAAQASFAEVQAPLLVC
jgi:hypothetical protein